MIDIIRYYTSGLYREMRDREVFLWAQAIAFKVLITLVPIIILATGVLGRVLKRERPFAYVAGLLRDVLPTYGSNELVDLLARLQEVSATLTLIGTIGLVITATTLFTTLRLVIAGVFREEWHDHRSILGGYLFDFRMAVQSGLLLGASIGLTVFLSSGPNPDTIAAMGLDRDMIDWLWEGMVSLFALFLPLALSLAMFFQLIWFTPKPHPPMRSALLGAATTAVLWEVAKYAFTVYARQFGGFDQGPFAALGDTFVLIIALVFWAYYSGLVLAIGAIVTLLHETRFRGRILIEDDESDEPGDEMRVESPSGEVVTQTI